MKFGIIALSALTAFVIGAGGVIMGVVGSGYELNVKSWTIASVVGAMAASKDIRSLMRMPPVTPATDTAFISKPVAATPPSPSDSQPPP